MGQLLAKESLSTGQRLTVVCLLYLNSIEKKLSLFLIFLLTIYLQTVLLCVPLQLVFAGTHFDKRNAKRIIINTMANKTGIAIRIVIISLIILLKLFEVIDSTKE